MPTITFLPSAVRVEVEFGTPLLEACRAAGFRIPSPCGGKGLCGKCRVRLLEGNIPVDEGQRRCLPPGFPEKGWRAACLARVDGDLVLADPEDGERGMVSFTEFSSREPTGEPDLWECETVMTPPSPADRRDDESRLRDALADGSGPIPATVRLDFRLLADLPRIFRASDFHCRAVGLDDRLLTVEDAKKTARPLALAVDLGTTTLAAALCDLRDGTVLAASGAANPQSQHGDDVISRLEYACRGKEELAELQRLAVEAIQDLSRSLLLQAGFENDPLVVAIAANTVMNHLLLGISPLGLAVSPFVPAYLGLVSIPAHHLGWRSERSPLVRILPNLASYVGGDVAAGILAYDVHRLPGHTLYLDIGTNGEIVLADSGRLYTCATAAGPAFEGARIRQGTRAVPGAICRVFLDHRGMLETETVENKKPATGICGSGLLDAVATLLQSGLIEPGGRLLDQGEARETPGTHIHLATLLHDDGDGPAFWLERPDGWNPTGVKLTQRDIREFQLAKGAIAAGVTILLDKAGLAAADIDRVMLAGGFGNYIDPVSAATVGLLPPEIPMDRIRPVGNAALAGSRLCALRAAELEECLQIAERMEYVALSEQPNFQAVFAERMLFPAMDPPE